MSKFKGKFRVESTRLPGWDYAAAGFYFVTICTKDREPFFGEVVEGEMRLSEIGEILAEEWQKTEQIREMVSLDEWVIMPNHLHGIIVIHDPVETPRHVETPRGLETPRRGVSTTGKHWKPNTLGAIINQIKSKCTKRIRAAGHPDFAWQARFYDHIIRDEGSLHRIRQYIQDNPLKWVLDENNPSNWEGK